MGRPYGLGPRVPMYVLSPWSRGGWVNSQVFDHTSVIRLLEARFGVMEPNISPWRRAVCGDLLSCFDFKAPNAQFPKAALPETTARAQKAAALPGRTKPPTPAEVTAPVQAMGPRLSRALPYVLEVSQGAAHGAATLRFHNHGAAAAVFHVYDRLRLDLAPRRYTVEPGKALEGAWPMGPYDLFVLGPGGLHRHVSGDAGRPEPALSLIYERDGVTLTASNPGVEKAVVVVTPGAYGTALKPWTATLAAGAKASRHWPLRATRGWYDLEARLDGGYRRFAGRLETGADSISDPAMGGPAVMSWRRA